MRLAIFFAASTLPLAGCSYANSEPVNSTPDPIEKPVTHKCNADAVQSHVGHKATQAMGATILRESGAKVLRWGPPDSVWTMDYREDRVNVRYDRSMMITAITCG